MLKAKRPKQKNNSKIRNDEKNNTSAHQLYFF